MSTTTVLYTDIARSSALLVDQGDETFARLFTDHVATIRRAVESQHGQVTKLLGDGVLAQFDSAYGAVRAARGSSRRSSSTGVQPGRSAALHPHRHRRRRGRRGGRRVYGATLVLARRLCDVAGSRTTSSSPTSCGHCWPAAATSSSTRSALSS